jgi:hypothetical protein
MLRPSATSFGGRVSIVVKVKLLWWMAER